MATFTKRGDKWFVQIRRRGFPTSCRSFRQKSDADEWARHMEIKADRGEPMKGNLYKLWPRFRRAIPLIFSKNWATVMFVSLYGALITCALFLVLAVWLFIPGLQRGHLWRLSIWERLMPNKYGEFTDQEVFGSTASTTITQHSTVFKNVEALEFLIVLSAMVVFCLALLISKRLRQKMRATLSRLLNCISYCYQYLRNTAVEILKFFGLIQEQLSPSEKSKKEVVYFRRRVILILIIISLGVWFRPISNLLTFDTQKTHKSKNKIIY